MNFRNIALLLLVALAAPLRGEWQNIAPWRKPGECHDAVARIAKPAGFGGRHLA